MTRAHCKTFVVLAVGVFLCMANRGRAADMGGSSAVATTERFSFHSDFSSNLHDALLEAGRDRNFDRPQLFQVGDEAPCFAALPRSARIGWDHAVAFYAEIVSPATWEERQQYLIRIALSGVQEVEAGRDLRFVELARSYLGIATPAYAACRWAAQDAENREWIAGLVSLLEVHEQAISLKLTELYHQPLAGLPIRVDVVETVNWSGATTILLEPGGGHIQASSAAYDGLVALEIIFHEASHTLMGHGSPIRNALAEAARQLGVELPGDLWHAVLFLTTGDSVRRVLETSGAADYTPLLFAEDIFGDHHAAMRSAWISYLNGDRTLDAAAVELVRAASQGEDSSHSTRAGR